MRYVIAGPCAIESVDSFVRFADDLVRLFERFPSLKLVYKGSFDKANRSRAGSPRGVGLIDAEVAWRMIRDAHPNLMLTTDVHETWQARAVTGMIDVIQIPAMLARQTDLIACAANCAPRMNVKIPVWEDNIEKFVDDASTKVAYGDLIEPPWFTYRGNGTNSKLVVDMAQVAEVAALGGGFLDLTHTNRGRKTLSTAFAEMVAPLPLGVFAEVHPTPNSAVCDAQHQLIVDELEWILTILAD